MLPGGAGGGLPAGLQQLGGEVARQARNLQRLRNLGRPELGQRIEELNRVASHFLDSNGKQLAFNVHPGTDTSQVFWKATVRIACAKIDVATGHLDSQKLLNLKQFLRVYDSIKGQVAAFKDFGVARDLAGDGSVPASCERSESDSKVRTYQTRIINFNAATVSSSR